MQRTVLPLLRRRVQSKNAMYGWLSGSNTAARSMHSSSSTTIPVIDISPLMKGKFLPCSRSFAASVWSEFSSLFRDNAQELNDAPCPIKVVCFDEFMLCFEQRGKYYCNMPFVRLLNRLLFSSENESVQTDCLAVC